MIQFHLALFGITAALAVGYAIYSVLTEEPPRLKIGYSSTPTTYSSSNTDNTNRRNRRALKRENCPICFDSLINDIIALNCSHCYHRECIQKWLKEKKYTCPVCRNQVIIT